MERPCEVRRTELAKNLPSYLTSHDLGTMCQPDGWFNRVQRNQSHFYCVDEFGVKIDRFGEEAVPGGGKQTINCSKLLTPIA